MITFSISFQASMCLFFLTILGFNQHRLSSLKQHLFTILQFPGKKPKRGLTRSSAQCLIKLQSMCQPGSVPIWRLSQRSKDFEAHSGHWQTSLTYSRMPEKPGFLWAGIQGPVSAIRGCRQLLVMETYFIHQQGEPPRKLANKIVSSNVTQSQKSNRIFLAVFCWLEASPSPLRV